MNHYWERVGGKLIKTKFVANVVNDPEGFKISVNELDFLDILVSERSEIESETRRILAEMLEIDPSEFGIEIVFEK